MAEKQITVTISLSTNPQVPGRYFVDVRDTTHVSDPLRAHQMTTRTRDTDGVLEFLRELRAEARRQEVKVKVRDTTEELPL